MERDRNNIGRDMPGSYTSVGNYTAKVECIKCDGIFEREEQFDDISKMGKHKICIQKQRVLV